MGKLGFIGCGNMAKAIMGGIISSKAVAAGDIMASDVYEAGLAAAAADLGIRTTTSNVEVARNSRIVFLAVKPHMVKGVIQEISPILAADAIVVSIAAGQTVKGMEEFFGREAKIVRTMPNTPALVGEGMTAVCPNSRVTAAELEEVRALLTSFGKCEIVAESLMDAEVAVAGSGPAYVFMFIEALADAAVLEGMPRDKAYTFVAQTVLGSAKMVLELGRHPGLLKDMVCSPAGTTIEAVAVLEERGFRGAVIEAVRAAARRSRELG